MKKFLSATGWKCCFTSLKSDSSPFPLRPDVSVLYLSSACLYSALYVSFFLLFCFIVWQPLISTCHLSQIQRHISPVGWRKSSGGPYSLLRSARPHLVVTLLEGDQSNMTLGQVSFKALHHCQLACSCYLSNTELMSAPFAYKSMPASAFGYCTFQKFSTPNISLCLLNPQTSCF